MRSGPESAARLVGGARSFPRVAGDQRPVFPLPFAIGAGAHSRPARWLGLLALVTATRGAERWRRVAGGGILRWRGGEWCHVVDPTSQPHLGRGFRARARSRTPATAGVYRRQATDAPRARRFVRAPPPRPGGDGPPRAAARARASALGARAHRHWARGRIGPRAARASPFNDR